MVHINFIKPKKVKKQNEGCIELEK